MTREKAVKEILTYFENNLDDFNNAIQVLDDYDGYLCDDRIYPMEYLNDFCANTEPDEILRRAFYGYDGDYTDQDGSHPAPFNPNSDYFYYNGYGNLVSTNYIDYSIRLDEYFVNAYIDNYPQLWDVPEPVEGIIDNIEEEL